MTSHPPSKEEARALRLAIELVGKEADEAMHVRKATRDVVEGIEECEATLKRMLATLPPQHSSGDARERAAAILRQARDDYGKRFPAGHRLSPNDQWAYSLNAVEAALSRQDRPEGARVCSTCKAIVSVSSDAMCCHCSEMPWKLAALGSQDRPGPDSDDAELIRRLRRKAKLAPTLGGGSLTTDGKATGYITDDGMRLVNPDGPAAAKRIEALASRSAPDGWVLDEALRRLLEKIARPCALGCTAIECPQPGEPPRADDSDCCIARRALAASPSALDGEAGDE